MGKLTEIHQNYDATFKEVFILYRDKTLDFLNLKLAKIAEPLNTEQVEVEVTKSYRDLLFGLADNTGLHMEWQAEISQDDMLRFLIYNASSSKSYKMPFLTLIFTNKEQKVKSYQNQSLNFSPVIINLGTRDGDALLAEIKDKLEKGEPVNEIELVYLPLYKSSKTVAELFKEVTELAPRVIADKSKQRKLVLLAALVANKFMDEKEYEQLWEAMEMNTEDEIIILKVAKKVARKKEKRNIAKQLLKKGIAFDVIVEATALTVQELSTIREEVSKYDVRMS